MPHNDQLDTDNMVQITDERVIHCFNGTNPDIGAMWELCVHLEWDRKEAVDGISRWLGEPSGQRILDCACGSGFPALDLIQLGYDVTCSDGSPQMIQHLRRNADLLGVAVEPAVARWAELSRVVGGDFDVVMCRGGGSLLYAGTWDEDAPPDREAMSAAVREFVACLRPGGRLYVDITRAENLANVEPQRTSHPPFAISNHVVELDELITTDLAQRLRTWHSRLRVDGRTYEYTRRSHWLPHEELVSILNRAGLVDVRQEDVSGETYAVFTGVRPSK